MIRTFLSGSVGIFLEYPIILKSTTRWAPDPVMNGGYWALFSWPYKGVTGVITLLIGVITLLIGVITLLIGVIPPFITGSGAHLV